MKTVLITRLTAMGDVAMTAPIVASVCRANPDVYFEFLSTPFFSPFFEKLPNFNFIGTNIRKEHSGFPGLWNLFKTLKKREGGLRAEGQKGFDVVIDLHDVLRTKVIRSLFRLAGVKVYSIDKGRSEKRKLVSGKQHVQLKPMTERYAEVFRAAGLVVPDEIYSRQRPEIPSAAMALAANRSAEKWIGISPFAQHKGKMYPAERIFKVVSGLLAQPNVRVFIFGGGSVEAEGARIIIDNASLSVANAPFRCHNMIGVMHLNDEMALMANLDAMVSMDSSNMHLCSLFGTRVVSIWGATHPFAGFLGYGQKYEDVVQRDDLDCRPCSVFGNKQCRFGDYRCFDIDPDIIVRRVLKA